MLMHLENLVNVFGELKAILFCINSLKNNNAQKLLSTIYFGSDSGDWCVTVPVAVDLLNV